MITIKEGDVDIGANPSAEGGDEGVEEDAKTVNNVVHSFRLTETAFDKKSYMTYIKGYMKSLKKKLEETNPERVPAFEKGAAALVKKILGNFKVCISIARILCIFFPSYLTIPSFRTTNSSLASRWIPRVWSVSWTTVKMVSPPTSPSSRMVSRNKSW